MMRSLFSGVAGLKNHQTRMDVTGNNIANVNTVGYKSGRTTFQDMLSQSIKGAAAPTGNIGGVNPLQVGLGMGVASVDNIFTTGSLQATGKNTDLAIDGDGFFIVSNGLQTYYTRAGNFDFDSQGNYVIPGTGLQVMGWPAVNGTIQGGEPIPLKVPLNAAMPPKVTSMVGFTGNLNAGANPTITPPATTPSDLEAYIPTNITVYDSEGIAHKTDITITKTTTPNVWEVAITLEGSATTPPLYTVTFNPDGTYLSTTVPATGIDFALTNGANSPLNLTYDLSGLSQYGAKSDAFADTQDGYTAGTLKRATLTVDSSGVIFGQFSNGELMNLGQVALALFTNPAGLTKVGSSLFARSNNSGEVQWGIPGQGGFGSIMPSTLEMSNVDLSEEFTTMITTQRGFQANSRIITTSDSMLEELVNLKR